MNGAASHDVQAIDAGPLRLEFQKCHDRFVHRLIWNAEDESIEWLSSVDTNAASVSPPLQELVTETRGNSDVLLSVGQAGRNHWSGVVKVDDDRSWIRVENACRVNQPGEWLGSVYRLAGECEVDNEIPSSPIAGKSQWVSEMPAIVLRSGERHLQIEPDAGTIIEIGEPDLILIRPIEWPKQLPATVVWGYRIGKAE